MYPFRAKPSCVGRYVEYTPEKLRYSRSNSWVYKDPRRDFVTSSSSQMSGNNKAHENPNKTKNATKNPIERHI